MLGGFVKNKKIRRVLYNTYTFITRLPVVGYIIFTFVDKINLNISRRYNKKNIIFKDLDISVKDKIFLICVAFNNEKLIEKQIELFNKYADKNTILIIADNSSDIKKREIISDLCRDNNVYYFALPKNPWKQVNLNHGTALNWIYYNFVERFRPYGFGFLDHDNFPVSDFNIKEKLDKYDMYGRKMSKDNKDFYAWYLWAGFCFFRYDIFNKRSPNFLSFHVMRLNNYLLFDTGGGNFPVIYKNKRLSSIFAVHKFLDNGCETIDEFLHFRAASFSDPEVVSLKLKNI